MSHFLSLCRSLPFQLSKRGRVNAAEVAKLNETARNYCACSCGYYSPSTCHLERKTNYALLQRRQFSRNCTRTLQIFQNIDLLHRNTISRFPHHINSQQREFRSRGIGSLGVNSESEEVKPDNLPPLDQFVFQISSDIRRKGRLNRKDIESAVGLLESGTSIGEHGTFLLACLGPTSPDITASDKVTMAQKVWAAIERDGKHTFESLDALLKCYAQNECKDIPTYDALTLLRNLQANLTQSEVDGRELKPSQKTYYYVLLSYCLVGDLTNAIKVLNMVKDEGIPVDEDYFNALIIGNARSGDLTSAEGILDIMTAVNIVPSEKTYAILLQSYIETNNSVGFEKIYTRAIGEVSFPQRRMLNLVNVAVKKNNPEAFKKILSWTTPSEKLDSDLINTAVSLVHSGFPEAALEVIMHFAAPVEVTDEPIGTFLIKEMVLADVDLSMITTVCDALAKGNYNRYAWNAAAEYTLKFSKFNSTLPVFELMKERNIPIRPHYFWPIIMQQFSIKGVEGLLGVVDKMHSFGVMPDWETNYDFIVPRMFMDNNNALQVAKVLKESANLSYSSGVLKAILMYLLKQKRLSDASHLVTKIRGTLSEPQCLIDVLFSNLLKFEGRDKIETNLKLAIPILKSIYSDAPTDDRTDFVGNFAVRFVDAVGIGLVDMVNKFIENLQINGICISQDAAHFLESQKHLTVSNLGIDTDLVFVQEHKLFVNPKQMNTRDLASHVEELKGKDMNVRGTLRQLFLKYCQTNDLTKILELKRRFEKDYGSLSTGMSSSLLGVYIRLKKLDLARELFQSIRSGSEDLEMDLYKILDLATLMAENDSTQEAFSLLLVECGGDCQKIKIGDPKSTVRNTVALLEAFHRNYTNGNPEPKEVLDFLLEKQLVEPTAPVLGILIKHLVKMGDLQGAVDLFSEYSRQYGLTPCRQQLTCAVLDNKDLLEKVLSCCKERYGEANMKHNLAYSLSDSDRIPEATTVFSGLVQQKRLSIHSVLRQAEFYGGKKEMQKLLNLIKAISKADPTLDCSNMYFLALKSCEISRNTDDVRLVLSNIRDRDNIVPSNVLRYAERLKKYSHN